MCPDGMSGSLRSRAQCPCLCCQYTRERETERRGRQRREREREKSVKWNCSVAQLLRTHRLSLHLSSFLFKFFNPCFGFSFCKLPLLPSVVLFSVRPQVIIFLVFLLFDLSNIFLDFLTLLFVSFGFYHRVLQEEISVKWNCSVAQLEPTRMRC